MIFGYLLLIAIPVAAVAYIVWDHKRKAAARAAASEARLKALTGVAPQPEPRPLKPVSIDTSAEMPLKAAPSTPAAVCAHASAATAVPTYAARERVLSAPQTLLYYLLRTGLPEYIIFPHVTLASILIPAPGLADAVRDERSRRLFATALDFVIVDKSMRPLAVVKLSETMLARSADRASMCAQLAAAGIRYLELDARALPRKDAMRDLVFGDADRGDAAACGREQATS